MKGNVGSSLRLAVDSDNDSRIHGQPSVSLSFQRNYFVNLRTSEIHLFYNLQLFYWHFLEILWLFIFLVFYKISFSFLFSLFFFSFFYRVNNETKERKLETQKKVLLKEEINVPLQHWYLMSFSCEGFWDHWREILELPLKQRHELEVQKKDTNNRPSETRNRRNKRKKIINKTSYFFTNSLNKSLNQMLEQKISPKKRWSWRTIRKLFYEKWIPFKQ